MGSKQNHTLGIGGHSNAGCHSLDFPAINHAPNIPSLWSVFNAGSFPADIEAQLANLSKLAFDMAVDIYFPVMQSLSQNPTHEQWVPGVERREPPGSETLGRRCAPPPATPIPVLG